ncbi:unnamed protein product, partial [Closterium sp. NIES-54]
MPDQAKRLKGQRRGAEPAGVEPRGVEPEGVEPGGADSKGAESGGAEPRGTTSSGAAGAGAIGDIGARGAGVTAGAGGTGGAAAAGPVETGGGGGGGGGDPTEPGDAGAGGPGAGGTSAGGAGAGGAKAGGAGAGGTGAGGAGVRGAGAVDARAGGAGGTERREPASRPASCVCIAHRVPCPRSPPVPGTHAMALRPSSVPLRVPLPAPPESSLLAVLGPESDRACAASPTVSPLLATIVTDPSFESTVASALVAELSASTSPPSVGGECALGTDVLKDRQEDFECLAAAVPRFASMLLAPEGDPDAEDILTPRSNAEAITGPYFSNWQAPMDAEMASWKSTCTYVEEVPPPGANIVDGMWIFRVKRPPGSPLAFKARYVARGFSQRQGVDYFQTFSPTPKMTTLRVLLRVAAQRDYELHSLDFSTAFLQGSLHEENWLRRPPGFTELTTLAALGFAPATADPSLFLRIDTSLPPFYVLVYVVDLVFATADTEALTLVKSELQKRHTCTDPGELTSYLGLQITRDRARRTITLTQSHMVHQVLQRFSFQFSLPQPTPLSTGPLALSSTFGRVCRAK